VLIQASLPDLVQSSSTLLKALQSAVIALKEQFARKASSNISASQVSIAIPHFLLFNSPALPATTALIPHSRTCQVQICVPWGHILKKIQLLAPLVLPVPTAQPQPCSLRLVRQANTKISTGKLLAYLALRVITVIPPRVYQKFCVILASFRQPMLSLALIVQLVTYVQIRR